MDNNNVDQRPIGERVAILETKVGAISEQLTGIETKLDQLLDLKNRGFGALSLVGLLLGSGVLGIIYAITQIFNNRPHL